MGTVRAYFPKKILEIQRWAKNKVPSRKLPSTDSFASIRRSFFYLSRKEVRQIEFAYNFAHKCHLGQKRKDGSPYIIHPMASAVILADMRLDATTIIAALLHDVVEDCEVSNAEILEKFGVKVAQIVEGVTKLEKLAGQSVSEQQAENFQKMIMAMASDLRVVLVKLADRLHNMRTLGSMSYSSKKRIARETLDIYAPIANRIGLDDVYRELQELAFFHTYPNRLRTIKSRLDNELKKRESGLNQIVNEFVDYFKKAGIKADVEMRMKEPYSVYRKMLTRKFDKISDVFGIRVVVEKKEQCYSILGIVHSLYKPNMDKIKDFIALPKDNGYQSIHTTVMGPSGGLVEVQIRSKAMDWVAKSGLASHWLYKKKSEVTEIEKSANQWISSIIDLKQKSDNAGELLENVKMDLFNQSIYVFTPQGKIISLPRGSTALDFAYNVHSQIGHHAKLAVINGEEFALQSELNNGDTVSIETMKKPTVGVASISYAKSARTLSIIRNYLRTVKQQELHDLGEHWLRQILIDFAIANKNKGDEQTIADLPLAEFEKILVQSNFCGVGQLEKILCDIALGNTSPLTVAKAVLKMDVKKNEKFQNEIFLISSAKMPMVKMASCCFPVPGDNIFGVMSKGKGLLVHRKKCKKNLNTSKKSQNLLKDNVNRPINIEWDKEVSGKFTARLIVTVNNSQGVLADVSRVMAEQNCNIVGIKMHTSYDSLTPMDFDVLVKGRYMMSTAMRKLKQLKSVKSITRYRLK